MNLSFFQGKRVFVTGHTGFKGPWLCKLLVMCGARVTGYALPPDSIPDLFSISGIEDHIDSIIGDIRDREKLSQAIANSKPDIVIHMAAQSQVLRSYAKPTLTYDVNIMGTVNILEAIRNCPSVTSFLNVTTDKVYQNKEWPWGYRENDTLGGNEPYSNSKACSELITATYKTSLMADRSIAITTVRAGNVIGGGDFTEDRIMTDCVRAALGEHPLTVRSPRSTRPYQHVLDTLYAYLLIAQKQYEHKAYQGSYNIGPNPEDFITTEELVKLFIQFWGDGLDYSVKEPANTKTKESTLLALDSSLMKKTFDWAPIWPVKKAVEKTVEWTKAYAQEVDTTQIMERQIKEFLADTSAS